ncbi:MAG: prolipoprotein diacylglyceryl transferase family protein, partial [Allosphingosinicella sp.]
MATAPQAIRFEDLGLTTESKIALDLGFFQLRWYSLAYLFGIIAGWSYLLRLLREPGAPMAKRHADDLVFFATLGIILGGRLGYVLF